ncbi:short-chain dehydrogenase [Pontibacillus chungwhensis BH030062]|uniref:Short-chain dehydrogenase n=1 Tax=Pontibacillus chungwhensis BH030062 TaxID=1385513 RepID=A0A0A2VEU1_9BACI|nr:SDR family NAD(P)-dependent oxidoreductase [Pontibacillus chungwhensis]KGP92160.1 short-chain dehydrogenase [Pontibacillus chungwhensis BH030062]
MAIFAEDALLGKHIMITGATGGIGYEAAKAAVQAGAAITITGRDSEKLYQLKDECIALDGRAHVLSVPADLNKEDHRKHVIQEAIKEIGPVYGLVNSAWKTGGGTVEDLSEEELRSTMELNFFSTVLFTQEVYREMKQYQKGAIVNLSSLSGLRGTYGNTAYSGSKFAITAFTQSFAHEAIQHKIRVNAVCPGFVDTEMGRNSIASIGEREGRDFEEQLKIAEQGLPSGRITQPKEVANSILFLLTDAAENIVGESLKISGGGVMR